MTCQSVDHRDKGEDLRAEALQWAVAKGRRPLYVSDNHATVATNYRGKWNWFSSIGFLAQEDTGRKASLLPHELYYARNPHAISLCHAPKDRVSESYAQIVEAWVAASADVREDCRLWVPPEL
jgi:hypothetical protein